jgi:hypothetical protein
MLKYNITDVSDVTIFTPLVNFAYILLYIMDTMSWMTGLPSHHTHAVLIVMFVCVHVHACVQGSERDETESPCAWPFSRPFEPTLTMMINLCIVLVK